jgi:hypothetical protein
MDSGMPSLRANEGGGEGAGQENLCNTGGDGVRDWG